MKHGELAVTSDNHFRNRKQFRHPVAAGVIGTVFAWLCLISHAADNDSQSNEPTPLLQGKELIQALQQGGYIIYFRHGITDHSTSDTDRENLENCAAQRLLSDDGIKQMKEIGHSIARLKIKASSILSSPYCRAIDTAKLAFGHTEIVDDLKHTVTADEASVARQAESLRHMLGRPPVQEGTNTVLAGHTANLQEATGIWPKPEGVAVIFKPLGNKQFTYIGTLLPTQWKELADQAKTQ